MAQNLQDYNPNRKPKNYIQLETDLLKEPWNALLDVRAVVIYSQLIKLCAVSEKNGWIDENGKIFVKYSIDEMAALVGVTRKTASKFKHQLIDTGLIVIPGELKNTKSNHNYPIYVKQLDDGQSNVIPIKNNKNKFNNFQQNDYEMSELENKLLEN